MQPSPSTFEALFNEHGPPIRRFLRLWFRNSATAEDLTQETFLHFWRRPNNFDPEKGAIRSYLFGIARKKAADWHEHNKALDEAAQEPSAPPLNLPILDALARLPEELRTTLWLREVEGYSYEELAVILNVPIGTVRSRLHTARQRLRKLWTNTEGQSL